MGPTGGGHEQRELMNREASSIRQQAPNVSIYTPTSVIWLKERISTEACLLGGKDKALVEQCVLAFQPHLQPFPPHPPHYLTALFSVICTARNLGLECSCAAPDNAIGKPMLLLGIPL